MKENVCEALVSIMYNWIGIFSHSFGMAGIMDFHYIPQGIARSSSQSVSKHCFHKAQILKLIILTIQVEQSGCTPCKMTWKVVLWGTAEYKMYDWCYTWNRTHVTERDTGQKSRQKGIPTLVFGMAHTYIYIYIQIADTETNTSVEENRRKKVGRQRDW